MKKFLIFFATFFIALFAFGSIARVRKHWTFPPTEPQSSESSGSSSGSDDSGEHELPEDYFDGEEFIFNH